MIVLLSFFFIHWYLSAFTQSFFLHRYMSHRMFKMSFFWERFFYLLTFVAQGSSFLHPKSYAQLHLAHHMHSDTEEDPHSPLFFRDVFSMMWQTKTIYMEYQRGIRKAPDSFVADMPVWNFVDRLGNSMFVRFVFVLAYTAVYIVYAPSAWFYLLLPIQVLIGPFHGAFVNWCGHRYGYASHETGDNSKNTFPWDLLFMGETFQNNHHKYPNRANFATRWFEYDMLYPLIWFFDKVKIVQLKAKAA